MPSFHHDNRNKTAEQFIREQKAFAKDAEKTKKEELKRLRDHKSNSPERVVEILELHGKEFEHNGLAISAAAQINEERQRNHASGNESNRRGM